MSPSRSLRTAAALGFITLAGALVMRLQLGLARDVLEQRAAPVSAEFVREAPPDPAAVPLAADAVERAALPDSGRIAGGAR